MHIWKKEGYVNCHLSEKAEEDQKEVKEAAVLFNAQIAGQWCRGTKQRGTLVVFRLLNLS